MKKVLTLLSLFAASVAFAANVQVRDLLTTTVLPAVNDYQLVDGSTNGTSKSLAMNVSRQVATRAALAALSVTNAASGQVVWVQGGSAAGDGGAAFYTYNSTSTATPDGVTIIQPASPGSGRWIYNPTFALAAPTVSTLGGVKSKAAVSHQFLTSIGTDGSVGQAQPAASDVSGLGGAAVLNVGTTVGTVAAGDDSRITGAAQKSANLSDLANVTAARTNLGVTATGADTTYAYRTNNLADLASMTLARTNLGVTATGADTTYVYRANNLSDLANTTTARTNLGLGSIATQNANAVDITGGSLTGVTTLSGTASPTFGTAISLNTTGAVDPFIALNNSGGGFGGFTWNIRARSSTGKMAFVYGANDWVSVDPTTGKMTLLGALQASGINSTPIGTTTPSDGVFTTFSTGIGQADLFKLAPELGYPTGGAVTLRLDIKTNNYIGLTTNAVFSFSGYTAGSYGVFTLKNTTGSPITISWPAVNLTGSPLPTVLAAGASTVIRVEAYGTTLSDLYAQAVGISTGVHSYANLTALKAATPPSSGSVVTLLGYVTAGDGGGGDFYWDASDTTTDNAGTIIQVTGVTTGRYHRIIPGTVSARLQETTLDVRWFGAIPDYVSDAAPGIQAAYNAIPAGYVGTLHFPAGNYLFNSGVSMTGTKSVTLKGDGSNATRFIYNTNTSGMLYANTTEFNLMDVGFYNVNGDVNNNYIPIFCNGGRARIKNVEGVGFYNVIFCKVATCVVDIDGVVTSNGDGTQLWVESSGGSVSNCRLSAGDANGLTRTPSVVVIATGGGSQTSLQISNCNFRGNGPWLPAFYGGTQLTIDGSTLRATMVLSGYNGPNHEGMIRGVLLDTVSATGNQPGTVCLLLEGRVNPTGGDVSGWNISDLYCNGGRYGVVLMGADAGSGKNVYSVAMANIYTLPMTGSDGLRFDQAELCTVAGVYTMGNGGGNGVRFVAGGSNPTKGIDVTGGILSNHKQPTTYGVYFDGVGNEKISVRARIDNPLTSAYVLQNGASKANGLVVEWPDASGNLNLSGVVNSNQ